MVVGWGGDVKGGVAWREGGGGGLWQGGRDGLG